MATLTIAGGVVLADGGPAGQSAMTIDDGTITSIGERHGASTTLLDATGCSVVAGFVDLQINGGFGVDIATEPERIAELAAQLPRSGVTSFVPTVVTSSPMATAAAIESLAGARSERGARILGVHLEGPFINPSRRGAHNPLQVRLPDQREAAPWSRDAGITMVTLAPEMAGALELIATLTGRGIVVSIGHTAAGPAEVASAAAAGAATATHLFNAMGPLSARSPGPAGAILGHPSLCASVIADGIHVDPVLIAAAYRALGPDRLFLVTDAIAALGLGDGRHHIGGIEVDVSDGRVTTAAGVLAGSVLAMDEAVRNLIAFTGCPLEAAVQCAATTPANVLGRFDLGRLAAGRRADVVLLDGNLQVAATVVGGTVVYDRDQRHDRPGRRPRLHG